MQPMSANYAASTQLMGSLGLSTANHTVMRENLAHYNAQLQTPISDSWDFMDTAVSRTPEEQRWLGKIRREIGKPYDDQQVVGQMEALDQDLRTLIGVKGSKFPSKLYVSGSINKGRFGGNSDLDVQAEGLLSDRSCGYLAAMPGWKVTRAVDPEGQTVRQSVETPAGAHVDFYNAADFEKMSGWFGKHIVVDVDQARQGHTGVREEIQRSFEEKGYAVSWEGGALTLQGEGSSEPVQEKAIPYPGNLPDGCKMEKVEGREATLMERVGDWLHR